MKDPCPAFTTMEQLACWALAIATVVLAWQGVSRWAAIAVLAFAWGGGLLLGMVIVSRNEQDPEYAPPRERES